MSEHFEEIGGLWVEVDDVVYMPTLDAPDHKPHPFIYFLTIHNESEVPVKILARKWVVREKGELVVVEGDGVVGQTPIVSKTQPFAYNSYHVLSGDGEASGSFFGVTEDGRNIRVDIPKFDMVVPDWV
ncbi:ApaG domain [Persicirhabdus sediminis]|uniref:ApaG domain n=1 Tax=Persicirhabdus sediminis TaxID=454144 RepID=A0A8J7MHC6_9BACT|nr:ApaG domain [Persicirhabdus sediminis]MBK1792848.1 ApaG domain [Persicirhabdus sediminis]